MNDFTKQELEQIYYHLENEPQELADKIKSMIQNYCHHQWGLYLSHQGNVVRCVKCNKEISNDFQ